MDRFINRLTFYTFGFIITALYEIIHFNGYIIKSNICMNILSYLTCFDKKIYLAMIIVGIILILVAKYRRVFIVISSILINYSIFSYLILTTNTIVVSVQIGLYYSILYVILCIIDAITMEFTGRLQE